MSEIVKISAIVVAAGLSSRMQGANKMLLPLHNSTVIGETLKQLGRSLISEKIVVTGRDRTLVDEEISRVGGYQVVHNKNFSLGLTTSIQAGVKEASMNSLGYMICLGDMPVITTSEYSELADFFESEYLGNSKLIVVPTFQGRKGNPVIFSSYYREELLNHQELIGCRKVIEESKEHVRKYELHSDHVVTDIDTQEDYQHIANRFR